MIEWLKNQMIESPNDGTVNNSDNETVTRKKVVEFIDRTIKRLIGPMIKL